MKFIVFTTDCPPINGLPTSGTALRTYGIAQGLIANGHEVVFSPPKTGMAKIKSPSPQLDKYINELNSNAFDSNNQRELIEKHQPDVILCGHWPALSLSSKPSQPIIIDLAGPHMLERHYQKSANQQGALLSKLNNLGLADYFIVSGKKQRYYFLSYLLRAGIENPENKIVNIPMALSPEIPVIDTTKYKQDPKFVFAGVFLPWQDPSAGLEKLVEQIDLKDKGSLKLIGGKHPNYKIKEKKYDKIFSEISKSDNVVQKPLLPYDEFISELADCSVALDLMQWNLERELAVTIRTTTFLWSGLPVIYNDYSDLSELIKQYNAGWTLESIEQLKDVINEIYSKPELIEQKAKNARELAKDHFLWDKAVVPLIEKLENTKKQIFKEIDICVDYPDNKEIKAKSFTQFFTCRVEGLNKIEFRIDQSKLEDKSKEELNLKLYECRENNLTDATLIAKSNVEFGIKNELNGDWLSFDFNDISNSAGRNYALVIQAKEELSAIPSRGCLYPLHLLRAEGKKISQTSLCIKTTCSGSRNANA